MGIPGSIPGITLGYEVDPASSGGKKGDAIVRGAGETVDVSDTAGEVILGVAETDFDTRLGHVGVQALGAPTVQAAAGVSIAVDADVASNGDGTFKTATTGDAIVGKARTATEVPGGTFRLELQGTHQPAAA